MAGKVPPVAAPAFFVSVFKVVLPQSDPAQLQDWLAKTAPSLTQSGGQVETTIANLRFVLSIPQDNLLELDIGELKN